MSLILWFVMVIDSDKVTSPCFLLSAEDIESQMRSLSRSQPRNPHVLHFALKQHIVQLGSTNLCPDVQEDLHTRVISSLSVSKPFETCAFIDALHEHKNPFCQSLSLFYLVSLSSFLSSLNYCQMEFPEILRKRVVLCVLCIFIALEYIVCQMHRSECKPVRFCFAYFRKQ